MASASPTAARRRITIVGAACAAMVAVGLGGCATSAEPSAASGAGAAGDLELPVMFVLRHDSEGLYSAAMQRSTPTDPLFRSWLTAAQIADRFGAPADVAERVLKDARAAGFEGSVDPTRGVVSGSMTASEAERLLGVQIQVSPLGTSRVVSPAAPPKVPRAWRDSVSSVLGLTLQIPAAGDQPGAGSSKATQPRGTGVPCPPPSGSSALMGEYYGVAPLTAAGKGGKGVRIALLQIDRTSQVALDEVRRCYQTTIPPVTTVEVDETDPDVHPGQTEESTLDIAAAALIAPNLEGITTYQFNPYSTIAFPLVSAIGDALGPDGADVISTSIGYCENEIDTATIAASEWMFAAAAAAGVTVLAASGDTGSSACAPQNTAEASQYPASSALVTAIGGTQFTYSDGRIAAEVVWNATPSVTNAGGGTPKSERRRPHYQDRLNQPGSQRVVPDVAFVAAPATFGPIPVCDAAGSCVLRAVGGTSATAPGVAGAISELMDAIPTPDDAPFRLGLLNPTIYALAADPAGTGAFVDVTSGTNDLYAVGCCTAGPGFDAATGWGSIRFTEFLRLLPR